MKVGGQAESLLGGETLKRFVSSDFMVGSEFHAAQRNDLAVVLDGTYSPGDSIQLSKVFGRDLDGIVLFAGDVILFTFVFAFSRSFCLLVAFALSNFQLFKNLGLVACEI